MTGNVVGRIQHGMIDDDDERKMSIVIQDHSITLKSLISRSSLIQTEPINTFLFFFSLKGHGNLLTCIS